MKIATISPSVTRMVCPVQVTLPAVCTLVVTGSDYASGRSTRAATAAGVGGATSGAGLSAGHVGGRVKVVALVQIVEEARMGRLPPHQVAGRRARGRGVDREQATQPAELLTGVLGRDRDHRHVQV